MLSFVFVFCVVAAIAGVGLALASLLVYAAKAAQHRFGFVRRAFNYVMCVDELADDTASVN